MPLPDFNLEGDLPEGVHRATMDEVVARFGVGTRQRQIVLARLLRVLEVAEATGKLERLIIFGSFITNKPHPNMLTSYSSCVTISDRTSAKG